MNGFEVALALVVALVAGVVIPYARARVRRARRRVIARGYASAFRGWVGDWTWR